MFSFFRLIRFISVSFVLFVPFAEASAAFTAPSNLTATNLKATTFTLKWGASTGASGGIAGYDVMRDGVVIGSTIARSFAVTGLAPLTTYTVTVRARDGTGQVSLASDPLSTTTLADTYRPSRPAGLAASGITTTSFALDWTASGDDVGVTGYNIYRAGTLVGSTPLTSLDITGLAPDKSHRMTVRAFDAAGNLSAASVALTVRTLANPPSTPTDLAVANLKATSFTLKWSAATGGTGGIAGYDVYRDGSLFGSTASRSFAVTGLTPLTSHSMTVASRDTVDHVSPLSPPLVVTTPADTTRPTAPGNLSASAVATTSFTLEWTASTDNVGVTGYDVYKNGALFGSTPDTGIAVTGLAPASTYAMKVKAHDAAGNLSVFSAVLPVATSAVPNIPPAILLATPPNNTSYTLPTTLSLSAKATDNDGQIARVEFYDGPLKLGELATPTAPPSTFTFPFVFASPGFHSLSARATDDRNAVTDSAPSIVRLVPGLPYLADFETGEGYNAGPLDGQRGWTVASGDAQVTAGDAAHGEQGLWLGAGASVSVISQELGAGATNPSPVFIDLFAKPAAGADFVSGTLIDLDSAQLTFVVGPPGHDGETPVGQFAIKDGDGHGGGTWRNLSVAIPLGASQATLAWQRLTVRLDYVAKTWDLFLNGNLVAAEIGFAHPDSSFLTGLLFRGHPAANVGLDDLYAGTDNPLFADADRDGMDDAWEIAHALNPALDDRLGDPDDDGLTNIQEYLLRTDPHTADSDGDGLTDAQERSLGTDPTAADSDNDGLPDGWEYSHGLNPRSDSDAATDLDGDGLSNLDEFQASSDPTDYYNGNAPVVTILVGGDGQPGPDGLLQIQVADSSGQPLPNAPVSFTVTAGPGTLATSAALSTPPSVTLSTRTLPDGTAAIYYRTPAGQPAAGTIAVQAGTSATQLTPQGATGGTNLPPVIAITAPSDLASLDYARAIALAVTAFDPDGSVARVDFFVDGVKVGESIAEPYTWIWSDASVGTHTIGAAAIDNTGTAAVASTIMVVVTPPAADLLHIDFEPTEGYSPGFADGQPEEPPVWQGGIVEEPPEAPSGGQILRFGGPDSSSTAYLALPSELSDNIVFVDFRARPPLGSTDYYQTTSIDMNGAAFSLVDAGDGTAEIWVMANLGEFGYVYEPTGAHVALDAEGRSAAWHRFTIRHDSSRSRWDLYLDGQCVAADREGLAGRFSWIYLTGSPTAAGWIDAITVTHANPLFADADRDGMDDQWEVASGLDPSRDDRDGDNDRDGVSNIQEFMAGTSPANSDDRDGNGLPDLWEHQHFGATRVDPTADADNDGVDNLHEYQLGTNPTRADSDSDGLGDGQELLIGSDPANPASKAPAHLTILSRFRSHEETGARFEPRGLSGLGGPGGHHLYWKAETTRREVHASTGGGGGEGTFHFQMEMLDPAGGENGSALFRVQSDDPMIGNLSITTNDIHLWNFMRNSLLLQVPPGTTVTDDHVTWTIGPVSYEEFGELITETQTYTIQLTDISDAWAMYEPNHVHDNTGTWGLQQPMAYYSASAATPGRTEQYISELQSDYQFVVPAGMSGTLHWLEIFSPANNPDDKQFTARQWQIDAIQSPVFTLASSANGSSTIAMAPELAVDANRDGQIKFTGEDASDATSSERPLVFWTNDNRDGYSTIVGEQDVQDDLDPADGPADCQQDRLRIVRDLQDWNRIWIDVSGVRQLLTGGQLKLAVVWNHVTAGSPAVKLLSAVESEGGQNYLTDDVTAHQQTLDVYSQKLGPVAASDGIFTLPADPEPIFGRDKIRLLFEGTERGKGELQWVLLAKDGQSIVESGPGVWIDLKSVKELYERWTVGDGPGGTGGGSPAAIATISTDRLPDGVASMRYNSSSPGLSVAGDPNENKYILYVHGWNMHPWEKDAFAETMLKRLYWQGYKGKFGTFQWPTTYHVNDIAALFDYDDGEFSAWRAAVPLERLLVTLNGPSAYQGNVYLFAHSMGNVVAGEALRQAAQSGAGKAVNTYVASQAALPGHCYDSTLEGTDLLSFGVAGTLGPSTPNIYGNWLLNTSEAAFARANFYNVNDFALGVWETDQKLKPDIRAYTYFYASSDVSVVQDLFKKGLTPGGINPVSLHLGDASDVRDRYEIMAYASEPRSKALGAIQTINGLLPQNLQDLWPIDTFPQTNGTYSAHPWHSAQFRFTYADQRAYWRTLLNEFGLLPR